MVSKMMKSNQDEHTGIKKRRQNFTMVDNAVITNTKLSAYDKAVYQSLCYFADYEEGTCYPKVATIAELAGCKRSKVFDSLNKLEKYKHIKRENRPDPNNPKAKTSNMYTLTGSLYGAVHEKDEDSLSDGPPPSTKRTETRLNELYSNKQTELTGDSSPTDMKIISDKYGELDIKPWSLKNSDGEPATDFEINAALFGLDHCKWGVKNPEGMFVHILKTGSARKQYRAIMKEQEKEEALKREWEQKVQHAIENIQDFIEEQMTELRTSQDVEYRQYNHDSRKMDLIKVHGPRLDHDLEQVLESWKEFAINDISFELKKVIFHGFCDVFNIMKYMDNPDDTTYQMQLNERKKIITQVNEQIKKAS